VDGYCFRHGGIAPGYFQWLTLNETMKILIA
jgi:hypothetical protein